MKNFRRNLKNISSYFSQDAT